MSHKNYSHYSKKAETTTEEVVDEIATEETTINLGTVTVDESEVDETPSETTTTNTTTLLGFVNGCTKLNVRNNPDKNAGVVCVIPEGAEVSIDLDDSSDGWYKVYTEQGFEGYCMAQYITVN